VAFFNNLRTGCSASAGQAAHYTTFDDHDENGGNPLNANGTLIGASQWEIFATPAAEVRKHVINAMMAGGVWLHREAKTCSY